MKKPSGVMPCKRAQLRARYRRLRCQHVPNAENTPWRTESAAASCRGADSCSTQNAGMRKRAAASAPSTRVSVAAGDGWNGSERRQVYWDSFLTAKADGGAGWSGATGGRSYVRIPGSSRRTRAISWHGGRFRGQHRPLKKDSASRPLNNF